MRAHFLLLPIVAIYVLIGGLFVFLTADWQAPDEPAHYNYVRQLVSGRLPVIEAGDYDQEYLEKVVFESAFDPQFPIDVITYEDWQPPLYYLLQAPVYWLSQGSLLAMRLLSVIMGAGVVILAYAIVMRIAPEQQWLALTTAVFVAFLPQHLAILSSVNNDSLAELIIAAVLFILVGLANHDLRPRTGELLLLGVLMGLGYLTKGSVYPLTAVVGLVLLWRYWGQWPAFLRAGIIVATPALILGGLWWVRNIVVYGGLDILGKAAHDTVVVGQPRTAEWIRQFGLAETGRRFVQTTFNSFWAQFGWMTLPVMQPGWLYPLLWMVTGTAVAGLVITAFNDRHRILRYGLIIVALGGSFMLTLAVHAVYNLTFVQHQGRYLFPALIPIALGLAIGLGLWMRPFSRRWPGASYLIPLALGLALLAFDLYVLFRVIAPAFGRI